MKRLLVVALASLLSLSAYAQENGMKKAEMKTEKAPEKEPETEEKAMDDKADMKKEEGGGEISDSTNGYNCTHNSMVRKIQIVQDDEEGNACSVKYIKETEKPGEEQTLWKAKHDTKYCEERAAGLANKLEGWGWSCADQ